MSSLVLLDSTVTVAESTREAFLDNKIVVILPTFNPAQFNLTVLTDSIVAGVAPFRAVCVEVWIDLGAGIEQIPGSAIGTDVQLSESMDNVVDQATFSIVGAQYDPLLRGALRGKQAVQIFISYGTPGFDYRALVFSGFLLSVAFDGFPPVAHCTALDSGSFYSEQLVTVDVKAGSGRSRLSILQDVLAAHSVPAGTLDLGGVNGVGGTVNKAVSIADMRLVDFIREFLSPCAVQVWFAGGLLNVTRITAQPAFVVVDRQNISLPLTMTPPATQVANTVMGVTVRTDAGSLGYRTVTRSEVISAPYAPMFSNGYGQLTTRVISQIDTTDTYYGDTIVRTEVNEYAWYARQAARLQINSPALTITASGFGLLYPDGTYRWDTAETFRLVRKTVTTRTTGVNFGGAGTDPNIVRFTGIPNPVPLIVTREQVDRYFYHFVQQAIYRVVGGVDTIQQTTLLTESGQGVLYPTEVIGLAGETGYNVAGPDSQTVTEWALADASGQLDFIRQTDLIYSLGVDQAPSQNGAFVYNTGSRLYKSLAVETQAAGKTVKTTLYTPVSDDAYSIAETTTATGTLGSVRRDTTGVGARPYAAKIATPKNTQELHSTIADSLRVTLSGAIIETLHNEYCETQDELRAVTMARSRDLAAINISVDMPLEGRMHKGRTIALDLAELGLDPTVTLYVWSVSRAVASYRQTLGLKLYAPGLL